MRPQCSECVWAKPTRYPEGRALPPDDQLLQCHRFPPSSNGFPNVAADDWCGEFTHNSSTVVPL